jgi:hypothetical protein
LEPYKNSRKNPGFMLLTRGKKGKRNGTIARGAPC